MSIPTQYWLSLLSRIRDRYPADAPSGLRQPSSHLGNLLATKSTSLGMIAIGSSSLGAIIMPILSRSLLPKLGYVLALVLEACIQHQAKTPYVDPLRISAYFLCPSSSKVSFAAKVTSLKVGKGFTNLKAELIPELSLGPTKPPQTEDFFFNLPHPTPAVYLCTLIPPESRIRPVFGESAKHEYTSWALDAQTLAKTQPSYAPDRTNAEIVGRLGLEWAAWYEFQKETEALGDVYIPLLVDMFNGSVSLLPSEERELGDTWETTTTLSIDFKLPISELGLQHSKRAIGLYSAGKFVNHPQSRHKAYVEVWTAPSEIGKGRVEEGWRDQQRCLAIATQMAISVPVQVNLRNAKKGEKGKL
ncbi:hypothetical protein BKA70DRAFT_1573416 [Coprinopsis sp. MPI-PUGE-AT-0042]|nr:hypothetical protein BKA70DRAFT_1573416 [Coprinopsis sp. MPI-PUGE-AT-0042]